MRAPATRTAIEGPRSPGPTDVDVHLATPHDEPDIRRLVAATPMPGAVAVRFAREPDYFLGTTIMGDPCDVFVGRSADGRLAGVLCRAEHPAFVNGIETRIGYIGQIRVADGFRGRWLLHRSMALFRGASPSGMLYTGVIARENPRARGVLLERRPPGGLRSVRLAGLTTCAIMLRGRRPVRVPGLDVTTAATVGFAAVVALLRDQGPRRQLYPAYTEADFTGGRTLRGLDPGDVTVVLRGGEVVGVMASWDQASFKQDIVDGYGSALRRMRPAYDLAARLIGARSLTPPGSAIPLSFAACTCVADDDPEVMRLLLAATTARARAQGKAYLMLGLADEDPLLRVGRRWLHVTYRSDLYALSWDDDPAARLDARIPYIEIGTL